MNGYIHWGKIVLLIVVMAIVAFMVGQNDRNTESQAPSSEKMTQSDTVYTNTKYGFSITLPKSWDDYKTVFEEGYIHILLPTDELGWSGSVTEDPSLRHYAVILSLQLFPLADFVEQKSSCLESGPDCIQGLEIGRTREYVVIARPAGDIPRDKNFQDKWLATDYSHENPVGYVDFFRKNFKVFQSAQ